jgi:glyoxylase-like metal-dependent hydrolase (beta-lactamase superfamily II)
MLAPMKRVAKWVAVILGLVVVGIPLGMRLLRHHASHAVEIKAGIFHVRNLFTDIYGVRTSAPDGPPDKNRVLVFDAGLDELPNAIAALTSAIGTTPDGVTDIFLSHGHFDHVAAGHSCGRARIYVGSGDERMLAQMEDTQPAGARYFSKIFSVPPITATNLLDGRQEIEVGSEKVLALPFFGHTAGSYLYLFRGVLFTGDSIQLEGGKLQFAMKPFTQNPDENRRNIAGLKKMIGDTKIDFVCTGHGACTPPGQADALINDLVGRANRK